jgi:hypothetical protein
VSSDLVCFFTKNNLQVFRIPERQSTDSESLDLIVKLPVHYESTSVVLGPITQQNDGSVEILFSMGTALQKVTITEDLNHCSCKIIDDAVRERLGVWCFQALRSVSVELSLPHIVIKTTALPLPPASQRMISERLGENNMSQALSTVISIPIDSMLQRVDFDEWTGLMIVHWMRTDSDNPLERTRTRYFTVFSLSTSLMHLPAGHKSKLHALALSS